MPCRALYSTSLDMGILKLRRHSLVKTFSSITYSVTQLNSWLSLTKFGHPVRSRLLSDLCLEGQYPASNSLTSSRFCSGINHIKVALQLKHSWQRVQITVHQRRRSDVVFHICKCCVTRNFDSLQSRGS